MKKQIKKKNKNFSPTDFNLLHDLVLVEAIKIEERGGVLIPNTYDNKPEIGKVLGLGPEVERLKKGDLVYFNKYSTTKFNTDGKDYYTVKVEDILGYIR